MQILTCYSFCNNQYFVIFKDGIMKLKYYGDPTKIVECGNIQELLEIRDELLGESKDELFDTAKNELTIALLIIVTGIPAPPGAKSFLSPMV